MDACSFLSDPIIVVRMGGKHIPVRTVGVGMVTGADAGWATQIAADLLGVERDPEDFDPVLRIVLERASWFTEQALSVGRSGRVHRTTFQDCLDRGHEVVVSLHVTHPLVRSLRALSLALPADCLLGPDLTRLLSERRDAPDDHATLPVRARHAGLRHDDT